MNDKTRLVARIGLFAALIYILSWATSYLPNVNLAFFIAFSAGYVWGATSGALVGGIGMWLWTSFNPFGPAVPQVALAQVLGMATCGAIGWLARLAAENKILRFDRFPALVLSATVCTLVFYIPVIIVDAWVSQPFWPRIITGLPFVGISLFSNVFIFPTLFYVTERLCKREAMA